MTAPATEPELVAHARPLSRADAPIVSATKRHLKWRALDPLEYALMVICGVLLLAFTLTELGDVFFRNIGHPWLEANEFAGGFFAWGVFIGWGAAVRRDEHFRLTAFSTSLSGRRRQAADTFVSLVMLAVSLAMVVFGYINFLTGFGSYLMPSVTPIAFVYAAIPVGGVLSTLFVLEQLINGLRRGFAPRPGVGGAQAYPSAEPATIAAPPG